MDSFKGLFIIAFGLFAVLFALVIEWLIKKGRLKRADTYSYKPTIKLGIRGISIAIIICVLIYIFSNSLETTITIGIYLLFCIAAGCLYGAFLEYQIKRRGGKRVE